MGKPTGFLESSRQPPKRRPAELRLRDWREVYEAQPERDTQQQASRCMDCGIPFCHHACPLGNVIPEWNDLVFAGKTQEALTRLHATNNFPEFTGRLCPAPCESACVLNINDDPVTIERIEYEIIEQGFSQGWVTEQPPHSELPWSVVVVGSGPAGLAAAQQLRRAGYAVSVMERHSEIGGLLRFGIPEFKMEKWVLDRRLDQLTKEGVQFHTGRAVGDDGDISLEQLRHEFDAVVLAIGSTRPRELDVTGRDLDGIYAAMEYLVPANMATAGGPLSASVDARGRDVVILGGGDTGADCLGTALRQGARSVTQLEIMERPPASRPDSQPWPTMPLLFKTTSAHEEGGDRIFAAETVLFQSDAEGRVSALAFRDRSDPTDGERVLPASLVLIAAGFVGPALDSFRSASLAVTSRGTLSVNGEWQCATESAGSPIFACGDAVRGQSLIVWAIAEGRAAAAGVDHHFRGADRTIFSSVAPYSQPWE